MCINISWLLLPELSFMIKRLKQWLLPLHVIHFIFVWYFGFDHLLSCWLKTTGDAFSTSYQNLFFLTPHRLNTTAISLWLVLLTSELLSPLIFSLLTIYCTARCSAPTWHLKWLYGLLSFKCHEKAAKCNKWWNFKTLNVITHLHITEASTTCTEPQPAWIKAWEVRIRGCNYYRSTVIIKHVIFAVSIFLSSCTFSSSVLVRVCVWEISLNKHWFCVFLLPTMFDPCLLFCLPLPVWRWKQRAKD